jgi:hypothetical protein
VNRQRIDTAQAVNRQYIDRPLSPFDIVDRRLAGRFPAIRNAVRQAGVTKAVVVTVEFG